MANSAHHLDPRVPGVGSRSRAKWARALQAGLIGGRSLFPSVEVDQSGRSTLPARNPAQWSLRIHERQFTKLVNSNSFGDLRNFCM